MQTKTVEIKKVEIIKTLGHAKNLVSCVILAIEANKSWKDVHQDIAQAVLEVRAATLLLARYHLETCILRKYQGVNMPIVREDIDEIIKTYRYLN